MNKFSERLRWLRMEHTGLTYKAFADRIDSSPGYISDLEKEYKTNPSPELIERISREFTVRREWLENNEGSPFPDLESGGLKPHIPAYLLSEGPIPPQQWEQYKQFATEVFAIFLEKASTDELIDVQKKVIERGPSDPRLKTLLLEILHEKIKSRINAEREKR